MKKKIKIVFIFMMLCILIFTSYGLRNKNISTLTTKVNNGWTSNGRPSVGITYNDGYDSYNGGATWYVNESVIQTANEKDFDLTAKDIISSASELLKNGNQITYSNEKGSSTSVWNKGNPTAVPASNVTSLDCSGLLWWTLANLNTSHGKNISIRLGNEEGYTCIPYDVERWITYPSGSTTYNFKEVGIFKRETKDYKKPYEPYFYYNFTNKVHSSDGTTYESNAKSIKEYLNNYTGNDTTKKMNVLKVSDPSLDSLKWYEYYDGNTKKELPAGTLIINVGGDGASNKTVNHSWIALGDLGTSDAATAIKTLNSRYDLNIPENDSRFVSLNTTSTYWRIEVSANKYNTGSALTINNAELQTNPDSDGEKKGINSIWAFQIASDETPQPHEVGVNIKKIDSTTNEILSGAKFKYWRYEGYLDAVYKEIKENGKYSLDEGNDVYDYTNLTGIYTVPSVDIEKNKECYFYIREDSAPNTNGKQYIRYEDVIVIHAKCDESGNVTTELYYPENDPNVSYDPNTATITLKNEESPSGEYSLNIMKKSTDSTTYGDATSDAIGGASVNVELYKDITKDKSDFQFGETYNTDQAGNVNLISKDITTEANKTVLAGTRDNLKKENTGETLYDIWKIKETKQPSGFTNMKDQLILGVEKNYDEATKSFTVKRIVVYKLNGNSIKLDSGNKWEIQTLINKSNNDAQVKECAEYGTFLYQNGVDQWNIVLDKTKTKIIITAKNTPTEEGTYNLNLVKKGIDGTQLGGVQFTANATINGINQDLYTEEKPLVTDASKAVAVGNTVTIDKNSLDTPDVYTLKELTTGDNTGYYVGLSQDIKLSISKAMKKGTDGNSKVYYVNKIELSLEGANVKNESDTKSIAKVTTEDNQEISIIAELNTATNTIIITVENPLTNGKFNFNLIKYEKGTQTLLSGAGFKIKIINKETQEPLMDANEKTIDGTEEYMVDENGKINIPGINIEKEGITYEVTIEETTIPEGYKGIDKPITFEVVSELSEDGKTYQLKAEKLTVENTKTVEIGEKEVKVELENEKMIFDLALRKWVTQAIVTENRKTVVTETGHKAEDDPEEVVKVDLRKSKLNDVTVKFRYSIRITNEGEVAGEATEIRDDIPKGLKFVQEDNADWREENGQIVTNKLAGTTLQPGESAEVEIVLTWINSTENMGVMINTAEINKDHNDYGIPDIDSTPGNNVPGEDDIDDAPVMITIKTGSEYVMYTAIALGVIAIIALGTGLIRKKVNSIEHE